jgi:signal transduction histidine kinase
LIQSARRLEELLADRRAIDWRAVAFVQALFLLFTMNTFVGWLDLPNLEIFWLTLLILIVEAFFLWFVGPALLAGGCRHILIRVWLVYWLAGELAAIYFVSAFNLPFIAPGSGVSAVTLLITNGFLKIVWFSIAHLATSLIDRHLQTLAQLQAKTAELTSLREEVKDQLALELVALRGAINDKIVDALALISKQLSALTESSPREELAKRASNVAQVCTQEVRALSHEISSSEFEPRLQAFTPKKSWSILLEPQPVKSDIQLRWEWVAAIGLVNAVTLALQHGGWLSALAAVGAIILGIFCIRPLDSWRLRVLKNKSARTNAILILAEYAALTVAILTLLSIVGLNVPEIGEFIASVYLVTPIVILVVWVLVQIIHNVDARLKFAQLDLAGKNRQLALEVEQAQAHSARARGRLGKLLHGTTQGRLASVSLALAAAADASSPEAVRTLLEQARNQLSIAEDELRETLGAEHLKLPTNPDHELVELVAGWRNLVSIAYELEPAAKELLEGRPDLAQAVLDAARECVTNAVRHGSARNIEMLIGTSEELTLVVINDGDQIDRLVPGFGVTSISATGADVRFASDGARTSVRVAWRISE